MSKKGLAFSSNSAKVVSTAKKNMTLFQSFTKFVKDFKCKFGKHKFDTWLTSNGNIESECSHCKIRESGMHVKCAENVWNKKLNKENFSKELDKRWEMW